jgi:hypothetical protein
MKLTKKQLKALIKEAIESPYKTAMEWTPEDIRSAEDTYKTGYNARKIDLARWQKEIFTVLGKVQREVETSPAWNDGDITTGERKRALLKAIGNCASALKIL